MFEQLPATNPPAVPKRKRALFTSVLFHAGLVCALLLIPLFAPTEFTGVRLLTTAYMAPPPPPPAPPAPSAREPSPRKTERIENAAEAPRVEEIHPVAQPVEKPAIISPAEVPKDIAKIIDAAPGAGAGGVIGGVPGGVPGGIPGGVPDGKIGGLPGRTDVSAPIPPPPNGPVRVGGAVREPRITKMVQPVYPATAVKQRIEGVVVLEATVTEQGRVEQVKVISGNAVLVDAAIEAVRQWQYEPTRLNGTAVPVLLTAKVSFSLKASTR